MACAAAGFIFGLYSKTFDRNANRQPGERIVRSLCSLLAWLVDNLMLITAFLFFLSAGAIYFACEFFVNGVEWLGRCMRLSSTATGTVLAAFGTALPESAVTFTAVVLGNSEQQKDIGVGAALGGPLVLATIAYGIVGLALLYKLRKRKSDCVTIGVDQRRLSRDQAWFLAIFVVKAGLGLVAFAIKPWFGILFLAAYAVYVWRELNDKTEDDAEELEALKIRCKDACPSLFWVLLQTLGALAVVAVASHTFVIQLEAIGIAFGMSPHMTALLLSPVATELPETMNAIIWVRQGKESLALANISGAMMIQATIPSALGLFCTPWLFDQPLMAAAVVTMVAIAFLWFFFRRCCMDMRLLACVGLLYGVFAGYVVWYFNSSSESLVSLI